jgi:hypothetical protein
MEVAKCAGVAPMPPNIITLTGEALKMAQDINTILCDVNCVIGGNAPEPCEPAAINCTLDVASYLLSELKDIRSRLGMLRTHLGA